MPFPAWNEEFGWRGVGQRADELEGRATRTVQYGKDADGWRTPSSRATRSTCPGTRARSPATGLENLRVFTQGGRTVVTWQRDGRTCVLSSAGASEDTLTKLAVWNGGGAVTV